MKKEKLEEQYVALRAAQVLADIASGVFEDYGVKAGFVDMTDDAFPFVGEMQDIYEKSEMLLGEIIIPEMSKASIAMEEKKVGDVVKILSDKPKLGNYLRHVVDKISEECGVKFMKPGDIIDCEKCGKKHIVGWDGSLLDYDVLSEKEKKELQSGFHMIFMLKKLDQASINSI